MTYPSWWSDGVRVVNGVGQAGEVRRTGASDWLICLDGESGDSSYIVQPDPSLWSPEVRQLVTTRQYDKVAHDAERALLRAFGCHYVPEYDSLPDHLRIGGKPPVPKAVGRPELAGLCALVRGAVREALAPYVRD